MNWIQKTFLRLIALIICTIVFSSCSKKEEQLQESGNNTTFDFDTSKPFEEYVSETVEIVKENRVDLNSSEKEKIIDWNTPFIKKPAYSCTGKTSRGIVLTHGLTGTPRNVHHIADYYQKHCFLVFGLLLTGHGTRPGDLLNVRYEDWIKQVRYATEELSKRVDNVYLGGHSTGAVLSFYHALENSDIKGLSLFAPAFEIEENAKYSWLYDYISDWLRIEKEIEKAQYSSMTTNAAVQLYDLIQDLKEKVKKNPKGLENTNIFAAFSFEDTTIRPKESIKFLLKNTRPEKRKIQLYFQHRPDESFQQEGVELINAGNRLKNVLSLSHIALTGTIDDEEYGINGSLRICSHYKEEPKKLEQCLQSDQVKFGELTEENVNNHTIVRIAFNPFFQEMLDSSIRFFLKR